MAEQSGNRLFVALAVVSTLCAVVLTGLVLLRVVFNGSESRVETPDRNLDGWGSLLSPGHSSGPDSGVTILVFSDFECPFCKRFEEAALLPAMHQFGDRIRVVVRHYPLSYHRFALPAAEAAECAAKVGKFFEMYRELYRFQDSLGLKPFTEIAVGAGVADTNGFKACLRSRATMPRVANDLAVAESLGLGGTPAVAVDGLLLGTVPDSARLFRLVASALAQEHQ